MHSSSGGGGGESLTKQLACGIDYLQPKEMPSFSLHVLFQTQIKHRPSTQVICACPKVGHGFLP